MFQGNIDAYYYAFGNNLAK